MDRMTRRELFSRVLRAAGVAAAWKAGANDAAWTALENIAQPRGTLLQRLAAWLIGRR